MTKRLPHRPRLRHGSAGALPVTGHGREGARHVENAAKAVEGGSEQAQATSLQWGVTLPRAWPRGLSELTER